MATVITMPTMACAAVATAMDLDRTRVAEASEMMTKQMGPTDKSKAKFQTTMREASAHITPEGRPGMQSRMPITSMRMTWTRRPTKKMGRRPMRIMRAQDSTVATKPTAMKIS